jgi:hypothetical protein
MLYLCLAHWQILLYQQHREYLHFALLSVPGCSSFKSLLFGDLNHSFVLGRQIYALLLFVWQNIFTITKCCISVICLYFPSSKPLTPFCTPECIQCQFARQFAQVRLELFCFAQIHFFFWFQATVCQ